MTYIAAEQAPVFTQIPNVTFTGLAAPSRGARDNAVWLVEIAPGTPGAVHRLTREEVIVALAGEAVATLDGATHTLTPGGALVVPPGADFALANHGAAPFRAVAVLPVGGQACMPGGEPFTPPWAA